MGKMTSTSPELAQTVVIGALTATGPDGSNSPVPFLGPFNIGVWGVFVGTVAIQTSYDGGTTWLPVTNKFTNTALTFTAPAAFQEEEVEPGVLYRMNCTAYTSGTINYRLSEGAQAGRIERLT
jgi:hypothetical protein